MRIIKYFSVAILLTIGCFYLSGCKTREQQLKEEARAEATKFWESRVFRKCGGNSGDYFGKREGKVYQFHGQYVVTVEVKEGPRDIPGVFEWFGRTIIGCYRWRTFENGTWTRWEEDKIVSPGLTPDEGRKALLSKTPNREWTFMYIESNPNAYQPVDCKEIESLYP